EILLRRTELHLFGDQSNVAKVITPKSRWKQGDDVRRRRGLEPQLSRQRTAIAVRGIEQKPASWLEQAQKSLCHPERMGHAADRADVKDDVIGRLGIDQWMFRRHKTSTERRRGARDRVYRYIHPGNLAPG